MESAKYKHKVWNQGYSTKHYFVIKVTISNITWDCTGVEAHVLYVVALTAA
jgi:hypothetical protein